MRPFTDLQQVRQAVIKHKEYARRRRQLMRMAGEESLVILQAAPARLRNNDVYFPYRQDSDFLYLTGFREPDALLVLLPEEKDGRSILFCRCSYIQDIYKR